MTSSPVADVRQGYVYPNEQPGWGIDFQTELAARFPCQRRQPDLDRLPFARRHPGPPLASRVVDADQGNQTIGPLAAGTGTARRRTSHDVPSRQTAVSSAGPSRSSCPAATNRSPAQVRPR